MSMKLCCSPLISNKVKKIDNVTQTWIDDIAMKLQTRCCSSTHQHCSRSSVVKIKIKIGTWAAGYSIPNHVRRRGSRIFPMQTRLYGWFSLVYGWGGHIDNVKYPSGFSAICRVHCTKAEMCGVDSPLDKLDIEVRVAPNMATVVEKTQQLHQQQQNEKQTH